MVTTAALHAVLSENRLRQFKEQLRIAGCSDHGDSRDVRACSLEDVIRLRPVQVEQKCNIASAAGRCEP